jgi:hypothetical protein
MKRSKFGVLALLLLSSAATAQSSNDDSKIILAPYLWGTSLNGTSAIGALPPLDLDASFGFSNLNMALSVHTEFHTGPWRFTVDPMYVSLTVDLDTPGGNKPKIDVEMWLVEAWLGYAFSDAWEVIAGVRYQDQDLSLKGLPSPPFPDSLGVSESWSDWFAGLRFNTEMGSKWHFTFRADTMISGDSDTNYNAQFFFNRRFGESKALNLGYRYMLTDYDNSGVYAWDIVQEGPVVGFTWVF